MTEKKFEKLSWDEQVEHISSLVHISKNIDPDMSFQEVIYELLSRHNTFDRYNCAIVESNPYEVKVTGGFPKSIELKIKSKEYNYEQGPV